MGAGEKKNNPRMSHSRMEILREMGSRSRRNRGGWRGASKRPAHGRDQDPEGGGAKIHRRS